MGDKKLSYIQLFKLRFWKYRYYDWYNIFLVIWLGENVLQHTCALKFSEIWLDCLGLILLSEVRCCSISSWSTSACFTLLVKWEIFKNFHSCKKGWIIDYKSLSWSAQVLDDRLEEFQAILLEIQLELKFKLKPASKTVRT